MCNTPNNIYIYMANLLYILFADVCIFFIVSCSPLLQTKGVYLNLIFLHGEYFQVMRPLIMHWETSQNRKQRKLQDQKVRVIAPKVSLSSDVLRPLRAEFENSSRASGCRDLDRGHLLPCWQSCWCWRRQPARCIFATHVNISIIKHVSVQHTNVYNLICLPFLIAIFQ